PNYYESTTKTLHMQFIAKLLKPLVLLLNKLGICSLVGFMAGAITGFLLMCWSLNNPVIPVFTTAEQWQAALLLWLFSFLVIPIILVLFCRYTIASIFWQTLVNTLLSSVLTFFVVYHTNGWIVAFFIGAVI